MRRRFDHHAVELFVIDHLPEILVSRPVLIFAHDFDKRVHVRLEAVADRNNLDIRDLIATFYDRLGASSEPDDADLGTVIGSKCMRGNKYGRRMQRHRPSRDVRRFD